MRDAFGRHIRYLRISVTDHCNLQCYYCKPDGDVRPLPREALLTFEEITEVALAAVELGIDKIRLTGGEPLRRSDIADLVVMLRHIDGLRELAMTTNGILLEEHSVALAQAGLDRVNISLDTLDPVSYRRDTGGGDIERVLVGIGAAQAAGLEPIKLNCVIESSPLEADARRVAAFAEERGVEVRFIRRMDLTAGRYWQVEPGGGGDCDRCNRLRLTSEGMIRPCLFSDLAFGVRELGAKEAIVRAVEAKPESGQRSLHGTFSRIGG